MSAPTAPESYTLLVRFSIKPDCIDAFLAEFQVVYDKAVQEKECSSFQFLQDAQDPTKFACIELWECSLQHLTEVQLGREYYKPYVAAIQPMMKAPREMQVVKTRMSYP